MSLGANELVFLENPTLSLGIKEGTDDYKSDTDAQIFMIKTGHLQHLPQQTPGLKSVPCMAASLNEDRFDVDATLEDLKDNPTLAASVMRASVEVAAETGILPKSTGHGLAADESATTITVTRAGRRARPNRGLPRSSRRKRSHRTVRSVAETVRNAGNTVNMRHFEHRLRSERSMTDQLTS